MINAHDVAAHLIGLGNAEEDPLAGSTLQKLLYYCQGFNLARTSKPLFPEAIQAWSRGPTVPEVWDSYSGDALLVMPVGSPKALGKDAVELVDDVFETYGQFALWRLRQMTLAEPPVKNTPLNGEISHLDLRRYFKTRSRYFKTRIEVPR